MEVLQTDNKDFHRLKNSDDRSSTIDEDEDDRSESDEETSKTEIESSSPSMPTLERFDERWLAQRNFLLYSQSLAMKSEEHSQFQYQQMLQRLSKEERERLFSAAALYPASNLYYPWLNPSLLPPPSIDPAATATAAKSPSSDDSGNQSNSGSTAEWTFEEQFRQLYELSDEPKRKEFLDDLFAFMQKRGTPVNRIPIMAKHVLDLYELFRLVVAKGGLVEVINKKLWREVTKGLNLPSSITSAAFTLRTQYMKYLYPYECEKLQLSSPAELQAAIEGNRREGRRPSYAFEYSSPPQIMPPPPPPPAPAPLPTNNPFLSRSHPNPASMAAAFTHPFFLAAAAAASGTREMNSSSSSLDEERVSSPVIKRSLSPTPQSKSNEDTTTTKKFSPNARHSPQVSQFNIIAKDHLENHLQTGLTEKSITLSMELNGIAYQGTLYATTASTGSKD